MHLSHFALTNAHPPLTRTPIQLHSYNTKVLDEIQAVLQRLSRLAFLVPGPTAQHAPRSFLPLLLIAPSSWHEANCSPPSRPGQARPQGPSDRM